MKILNLYAGIGGNRKLWPKDIQVTAIEKTETIARVYRDQYPHDKVYVCDAHKYLEQHYNVYDFIWSSPPCQSHSRMMKATRHDVIKFSDLKLYEEIIFLQNFYKGKWVVENVIPYYKPLISGQIIDRHIFWSNFYISDFKLKKPKKFIKSGSVNDSNSLKRWLGIYYKGNVYYEGNHCPNQVLRNCVHPKLGLHIWNCAFRDVQLSLMDT